MRLQQYLNESKEALKNWKEYIKGNKELSAGVKILDKIEKKKYKAFLVGGCVRDIILGKESKDYDIATNMPIDELNKMFKTYDIGKSKDFGIVVVKQDGFDFEIAQFRNETYVKPKYVRKILK